MTNNVLPSVTSAQLSKTLLSAWYTTVPFGMEGNGGWEFRNLRDPATILFCKYGQKGCFSCSISKEGFVVRVYRGRIPKDIVEAPYFDGDVEWRMDSLAPGWALPFIKLLELP